MLELVYTSLPEGLQTGRSGFAPVAQTRGMPAMLSAPLENMSVYRHLYLPGTAESKLNPVSYAWTHVRIGQEGYPVLSRIGDAGVDYTGRSNLLAHHILLQTADLAVYCSRNPASFLLAQENFMTEWSGMPRLLEPRTGLAAVSVSLPAVNWQRVTGDAGYAGWVARMFLDRNRNGGNACLYLVPERGVSSLTLLRLAAEAAELLPPAARLAFTFNTYFCQGQDHIQCFLRCCVSDSPWLKSVRQSGRAAVLEIPPREPLSSKWDADPLVIAARTGFLAEEKMSAAGKVPHPPAPSARYAVRSARKNALWKFAEPDAETVVLSEDAAGSGRARTGRHRMILPGIIVLLTAVIVALVCVILFRSGPDPAETVEEQVMDVRVPAEGVPAAAAAEQELGSVPAMPVPAVIPMHLPAEKREESAAEVPAAPEAGQTARPLPEAKAFEVFAGILELALQGGGELPGFRSLRTEPELLKTAASGDGIRVEPCAAERLRKIRKLYLTDRNGALWKMPWGMRRGYLAEYQRLYRKKIQVNDQYEVEYQGDVLYSEFQKRYLRKNDFPMLDFAGWNRAVEQLRAEISRRQARMAQLKAASGPDPDIPAVTEAQMRKKIQRLSDPEISYDEKIMRDFCSFAAANPYASVTRMRIFADSCLKTRKDRDVLHAGFRKIVNEWQILHDRYTEYWNLRKGLKNLPHRLDTVRTGLEQNARKAGLFSVIRPYIEKNESIPMDKPELIRAVEHAVEEYDFFKLSEERP